MAGDRNDDLGHLHKEVARRQYYPKSPPPIAEALSTLLARRGYAQVEAANQRQETWMLVVGERMSQHSCAGNVRRGVLEVTVRNSTVLQELTFQKRQLLKKLLVHLPDANIRDLRFRVGVID